MTARGPRASATVEIINRLGLHARAARLLVEAVRGFDAEVTIRRDEQTVNAKSILEIMMLAAGPGTALEVVAVGPDADDAVAAIRALVEQRFNEAE
ncbi:MAG TPA: HPr family phosphocarrier protein [Candidatus Dormibacteraeota bacterium]|nr:HPr family phosphocarrier protein [Candidatus Dormibacteraeota bacterium]